ncbi:MAG: DUF2344 domain-containing protein [Candidatus Eisenbacteria bacterium]|uniref:DUF2344 domain-containing protein n=1 Tax=Eiseniibacteriota bacterium TaxID=2212470 RepID=A0A7Y2E9N8_UNCEI|nr:DUF2344 domain-containing protein [Candidatus Eisenbacteria bacterium]
MATDRLEETILPRVARPNRYIFPYPKNLNSDQAKGKVCLVVPSLFERALAGMGVRSLFPHLRSAAEREGFLVDLCFAPHADFQEVCESSDQLLFGLDSRLPLNEFDALLLMPEGPRDFPELVAMMQFGGVDISEETGPLRILLGPMASALGLHSAVDIVLPGDPEAYVSELMTFLSSEKTDRESAKTWAKLVTKAEGRWLDEIPEVEDLPVETSLEAVPLEIARGPENEFVSAPVRTRSIERAVALAEDALCRTGHREVRLYGATHFTNLVDVLERLHQKSRPLGVHAQVDQLNIADYKPALARELLKASGNRVRFGPIHCSEQLRLNHQKPFSKEDLLRTMRSVMRGGWNTVDLTLFLGAEDETAEDRSEALEFLKFVAGLVTKDLPTRLSIHLRPVLKSDGSMLSQEEWFTLTNQWREALEKSRVKILAASPEAILSEAALMRDPKLGSQVLERLVQSQARRQGERESYQEALWAEAWNDELRLSADAPQLESAPQSTRSMESHAFDAVSCQAFGVPGWTRRRRTRRNSRGKDSTRADRYRIRFSKSEPMRFTSHLEVGRTLERAFRRSQLPVASSQGKNPRPKVAYGPPLALGMTSGAEYVDVQFGREVPESFVSALNQTLPEGIDIVGATPIRNEARSLGSSVEVADYHVWFPDALIQGPLGDISFDSLMEQLEKRVSEVRKQDTFMVTKVRKDQVIEFNAKPSLIRVEVVRDDGGRPVLSYRQTLNRSDSARPEHLTAALCDWWNFDGRMLRVHRSGLYIPGKRELLDPMRVVQAGFAWWRQPVRGGLAS